MVLAWRAGTSTSWTPIQMSPGGSALHHPEVVGEAALPPGDDAPRVVEPGEEAFDLPPAAHAPERATVLRAAPAATVRRDHLDAIRVQELRVERIAVVAAIADQARREIGEEAGIEGGRDEVRLMR